MAALPFVTEEIAAPPHKGDLHPAYAIATHKDGGGDATYDDGGKAKQRQRDGDEHGAKPPVAGCRRECSTPQFAVQANAGGAGGADADLDTTAAAARARPAAAAAASCPYSSAVIDAVRSSPYHPACVMPSAGVPQSFELLPGRTDIRINDVHRPVAVESELFCGQLYVFLPGLPSTPPGMFEGKKRKFWLVMQGRFKRRICMADLIAGCHYHRPFNLRGAGYATGLVLRVLASVLPGGVVMDLVGKEPKVIAPWASTCQVMNVSREGEAPPALEAADDLRLLGPEFAGKDGQPWPAERRRSYFQRSRNRRAHAFDTDHVWTFHAWDKSMSYAECSMHFGAGMSVDLVPYFDGMPLQFMLQHSGGDSSSGSCSANKLFQLDFLNARQAEAVAAAAAAAAVGTG